MFKKIYHHLSVSFFLLLFLLFIIFSIVGFSYFYMSKNGPAVINKYVIILIFTFFLTGIFGITNIIFNIIEKKKWERHKNQLKEKDILLQAEMILDDNYYYGSKEDENQEGLW